MTEALAHGTKNFKVSEFACKCGRFDCPHYGIRQELIDALQKLRDFAGVAIFVNSGYRCPKWNKAVGGSKGSMHMKGLAADIWCEELTPEELKKFAEEIPEFANGGIGIYDWGIHVDVRGGIHVDVRGRRARWDRRTKRK